MWEAALRALGDEIHLAGGQVRHVRAAAAEAVRLLRLLAAEQQAQRVGLAGVLVVNFHGVGPRQPEAQDLGFFGNFLVVHRQTGLQDQVVDAMKRRAAEAVLLGERRQRSRGGTRRDTEDQVVVGVDVPLQAEFPAGHVHREVRQVEVGTAGLLEGKHLTATQIEFGHHVAAQRQVKVPVGVRLDGQRGIFQEREIPHRRRVRQVNQHTDAFAGTRRKHRVEQSREAERGKRTRFPVWLDDRGEGRNNGPGSSRGHV